MCTPLLSLHTDNPEGCVNSNSVPLKKEIANYLDGSVYPEDECMSKNKILPYSYLSNKTYILINKHMISYTYIYGTMSHSEVIIMEKKKQFEVGICYVVIVKEIKSVPIV